MADLEKLAHERMTREQLIEELRSSRLNASHGEKVFEASETHYRSLFEGTPVSTREEDFSKAKAHIDSLGFEKTKDFAAHSNLGSGLES